MIGEGEKAPDFTLFDSTKKQVTLSKELGEHPVVLAFFPGAFTGTCQAELCSIRDRIADFEKVQAKVLAISVDSPFANQAFKEKNSLPFPLLSDFDRQTITHYGLVGRNLGGVTGYSYAKRSVLILDRAGAIRWKWVTEDPGVAPDVNQVIAALSKAI